MNIKEMVVNNIAFAVIQAVEKEVDGSELAKKLDEIMDKKFDDSFSERLQRGPLTNFLLEIVTGLYAEQPIELVRRIEEWQIKLKSEAVK